MIHVFLIHFFNEYASNILLYNFADAKGIDNIYKIFSP